MDWEKSNETLRAFTWGQAFKSSALRIIKWRWEKVTEVPKSTEEETCREASQILNTLMSLDSGPRAALRCRLYLALHSSTAALLPTRLCHFPNYTRNGPQSGQCLHNQLTAVGSHTQHLTIRFMALCNYACQLFWTSLNQILGPQPEKKMDLCATSACKRLPKRHNLDVDLLQFLRH